MRALASFVSVCFAPCAIVGGSLPFWDTSTQPSELDRLSPARVPAWAQTGRFRYARWDGGILDVAKGLLSGWPAWREPDQLLACAEWYEPRNVELIEEAGVNWIWATFSNGFSLESERPHQERLRAFIAACHRRGIHVSAYMSMSNMFPDDMFVREPRSREWLAQGKDGNPIPYGGADYSSFTRVTRYLACLQHPEWRAYLKTRVERAVQAGCDGVMWDNAFSPCRCPRCQAGFSSWRQRTGAPDDPQALGAYNREMMSALLAELQAHAHRPDFLMYANCHKGLYSVNRAANAVDTEDGFEPGLDSEGRIVSNIGTLRYLWAEGEGWRPVRVEYQFRLRSGPFESRFTVPLMPRSHQLAIAEAAAHHVGFELYSLGRFQRDLFLRKPAALANLKAAGAYNKFLGRHESEYVSPRSLARIALLANDDDRQMPASQELGNRGVLFDVLFTSGLTEERLKPYTVLIAPDLISLSSDQATLLARYVEKGARLVVSGGFGERDENFRPRDHSILVDWFRLVNAEKPAVDVNVPKGRGVLNYRAGQMDWESLATGLMEWAPPPVRVQGPSNIRFNLHAQTGKDRWLLHLLNYGPQPVGGIQVSLAVPAAKLTIITPDHVPAGTIRMRPSKNRTEFTIQSLDIYSVVLIQPAYSSGLPK